jgi:hypothetical protein
VSLSIWEPAVAQLCNRRAVANGRQDVVQELARKDVVVDVSCRNEWDAGIFRRLGQLLQSAGIIWTTMQFRHRIAAIPKQIAILSESPHP